MKKATDKWSLKNRMEILRDLVVTSWHEPDEAARIEARHDVYAVITGWPSELDQRQASIERNIARSGYIRALPVKTDAVLSKQKPAVDAENDYFYIVPSTEPVMEPDVNFTDGFFNSAWSKGFTRVLSPVFSPDPAFPSKFSVKTSRAWLPDCRCDAHASMLEYLSEYSEHVAHAIAGKLNEEGQAYVFSITVCRPAKFDRHGFGHKSRCLSVNIRSARALNADEKAYIANLKATK